MEKRQAASITALGPEDPDDGDEGRKQRGLAIAALVPIKRNRLGYQIPSQSDNGSYVVNLDDDAFCSCPDFEKRQEPCKHIYATSYSLQRETYNNREWQREDSEDMETVSERKSYWQVYNLAQANEQEMLGILLRDLCDTLPQPPREGRGKGRPRHLLGDMIFACALKVYSEKSGRRNMTNLRNAAAAGLMEKYPSFTTVFRYMEDPALTPILHSLIEKSSLPLTAVETKFAADASGFSTSVHDRWYADKWGSGSKQKKGHARYLKVHLMCGVETNVITKAIITDADSHDGQHLPELVRSTDKNFEVREVMGDKAYLSGANLRLVSEVGATPLIPFKSNSKARYNEGRNRGSEEATIWNLCYHYFKLHQEEFKARYHKRSNVESTFSMVKAKFGGRLLSKREDAQVNEALLKLLCHNICVLIMAFYRLGIKAEFKPEEDKATDAALTPEARDWSTRRS